MDANRITIGQNNANGGDAAVLVGNLNVTKEVRFNSSGSINFQSAAGNIIFQTPNFVGVPNLNVSGYVYMGPGQNFFFQGNRMFEYGSFTSGVTQSGSSAVSQSVQLTQDEVSSGVSLVSGTRITLNQAGTYTHTFSTQLLADTGADTVHIWWKKNGVNIPSSATRLALANNEENVMTVNLVDTAAGNDYYEVVWQTDNGDAVLLAEVATGNIPAVPSIIYTVCKVR